ncbi:hypothetical protein GUJ93_ZPchr0001g32952, partial [Zizania palustris]
THCKHPQQNTSLNSTAGRAEAATGLAVAGRGGGEGGDQLGGGGGWRRGDGVAEWRRIAVTVGRRVEAATEGQRPMEAATERWRRWSS